MKKITFQRKGNSLIPFSKEDSDLLLEFKENKVLVASVSGTMKERSLTQLRLFFGCCRIVVDNTEDAQWDNVDKVLNQVKIALQFVDLNKSVVDARGVFHPHYRSISFKNLRHLSACNFFDQAWPILAGQIGVTVDELLRNSEG